MMGMRFRTASTSLLIALLLTGIAKAQQDDDPPPASARRVRSGAKSAAGTKAAEASPFHITGRVINSLTRSPVARAEVTVSPMGVRRANGRFAGRGAGQTIAASTDAEGRFAVEVPSAGGWSLSVATHGYRSQALDEHDGYSTAIILTEGNPTHDVVFRLTPAAAIEGYVLDEAGEAVRNAQLTVSLLPPATPEEGHPRPQTRGSQRTDDRGYYKFSGLLSGDYDVRVQAQPWYATNGGGNRFGSSGIGSITGGFSAVGGSVDPSSATPDPLDVVYPVVWFPGVTDLSAATPISLREGETKVADFHLLPEPGFHLRLPSSNDGGNAGGDVLRNNPYLVQVLPDGAEIPVLTIQRTTADGSMEYSGLAPGTYVVHQQGEGGQPSGSATVRIAENSAHVLDASQATLGVAVSVKIEPEAESSSLQISFRDLENGHVSSIQSPRSLGGARGGRGGRDGGDSIPAKSGDGANRTIDLQTGRYEVFLNGGGDVHLVSIDAKGATAVGRTVTITSGAPVLTLHIAHGRASVTGFVQSRGKPVEGAMVLLVPATQGDPSGLEKMRRDQSNTDGSFDITGVLPGAYILVAIDHGWDVNWADPTTLRRFLMRGLPLDLSTAGEQKETLEALLP